MTKTTASELVTAARAGLSTIRERTGTGAWGFGYVAEGRVDGKWVPIPPVEATAASGAFFATPPKGAGLLDRVDAIRYRHRAPERVPFVSAPAENLIGVENRADDAINEHESIWAKPGVVAEDAVAILRRLAGRVDETKLQAAIEAVKAVAGETESN